MIEEQTDSSKQISQPEGLLGQRIYAYNASRKENNIWYTDWYSDTSYSYTAKLSVKSFCATEQCDLRFYLFSFLALVLSILRTVLRVFISAIFSLVNKTIVEI